MAECRLELHPQKTKIVYCKDDDRRGTYPHEPFDFLGYTFRPRRSKNRWGKYFVNFQPAASAEATRDIRRELRRWHLHTRSDKSLEDLSRMFNPVLRGWVNYYGRFYKSALYPTFQHVDRILVRLGAAEVQASAGPSATSGPVAATDCPPPAGAVRALASLAGGGWTIRAG